jgi:uncharacterized protein (DUF362 family)
MKPNIIVKADVRDSRAIGKVIEKAVGSLGGFSNFIQPGDVVLIKPNYNTADPSPASTAPDFLEATIKLAYQAGAKTVIVGESCTFYQNTRKVLQEAGVVDICKRLNAKLYVFEERYWIKKETKNGKYLKKVTVPSVLDEVDKTIILPCLKTHFLARFTISLKLAVGLMKPRERMSLHMSHLEEKVAELNTIYDPDLILVDGRKAFVTKGPSNGKVEEPNIIIAGTDRVAVDVEGVKVLQSFGEKNKLDMPVWELPQIKAAVELGLGAANEEEYLVEKI